MPNEIPLIMWKYRCGGCGTWYQHHDALPEAYGQFLMRSEDGLSERILFAPIDPVLKEVGRLVRAEPAVQRLSERNQSHIVQLVFSVACDVAENGSPFRMSGFPPCPQCGSRNPAAWDTVQPGAVVDVEVPSVTHQHWSTLNETEKRNLVKASLKALDLGDQPQPQIPQRKRGWWIFAWTRK